MIIVGNQRSGGKALSDHLLNTSDNEFVEPHEVRGFLSSDVEGAFLEIEAIAKGTRCKQPFFSVSLSPPMDAVVDVAAFNAAIARVEAVNNLTGQPRVVIFHEKAGRRHAHAVWSRIDAQTMTARNLSHYKRKLNAIAHDLFLEHGWDLPAGFSDQAEANSTNVTLAEWQAAKRRGRNAIDQKALIRQCWEQSDSKAGFEAALAEHGYALARGDRRSHVIVTGDGQVIAVARAIGRRTKEVRERLGPSDDLPDIETAREKLVNGLSAPFVEAAKAVRRDLKAKQAKLNEERATMIARHQAERAAFDQAQAGRQRSERAERQSRLRRGFRGLWDRVTGKNAAIIDQNRREAAEAKTRDQAERGAFVAKQLKERRAIEEQRTALRQEAFGLIQDIRTKNDRLFEEFTGEAAPRRPERPERASADPRQTLTPRADKPVVSDEAIRRDPAKVLDLISHKKARFTETDVTRALANVFSEPVALRAAKDKALASSNLVRTETGLTTRDYLAFEAKLANSAEALASKRQFGVDAGHARAAMNRQDRDLRARFGAELSDEQRKAVSHILGPHGIACLVGLAGAGKTTILTAAHDAWMAQGLRVHGAALAGKAAEGLEAASGMQSRTLASLELSWANGNEPIAAGDVLVIDEAGMIGTRQLARVASKIEEIGAKLVLVGDPDQLPPIEAGEPFRDLIERHGAAKLTSIHRQKADWQRAATRDLAEGNIDRAIGAYGARGAVTSKRKQAEAIASLVDDFLSDRQTSGSDPSRLALAYRRRDVHALNQSIREALKAQGDLARSILFKTETGFREMASGERIAFTRNDREIGVKNGLLGTVTSASASQITVRLDAENGDARLICFNPACFDGFDHGYAVTIHKSQGATVDRSFVLASRGMDAPLAYVAMTRHREQMKLYAADTDRPQWLTQRSGPHPRRNQEIDFGPEL